MGAGGARLARGRGRDPQEGRVCVVPLAEAGHERRLEGRYVGVHAPPVEANAVGSQRQLELGAEPADDVLVRVDPLTTLLDDEPWEASRTRCAADAIARLEDDHLVAGPVQPPRAGQSRQARTHHADPHEN